jgi:hypothetical protein
MIAANLKLEGTFSLIALYVSTTKVCFSPLRTDSLPVVSKIYWLENADDAIIGGP